MIHMDKTRIMLVGVAAMAVGITLITTHSNNLILKVFSGIVIALGIMMVYIGYGD